MSIVETKSNLAEYRPIFLRKKEEARRIGEAEKKKKSPKYSQLDPDSISRLSPSEFISPVKINYTEPAHVTSGIVIKKEAVVGNITGSSVRINRSDVTPRRSDLVIIRSNGPAEITGSNVQFKRSEIKALEDFKSDLKRSSFQNYNEPIELDIPISVLQSTGIRNTRISRPVLSRLNRLNIGYSEQPDTTNVVIPRTVVDGLNIQFQQTSTPTIVQSYSNSPNNIQTPTVTFTAGNEIPRGGSLANRRAEEDLDRFTDFLETPRGRNFIQNQRRLSLMNPNVDTRRLTLNTTTGIGRLASKVQNFASKLQSFASNTGFTLDPSTSNNKIFNRQGIELSIRDGYRGLHAARQGVEVDPIFTKYEEVLKHNNENSSTKILRAYREIVSPVFNTLASDDRSELPVLRAPITQRISKIVSSVSNISNLVGLGQTGFGRTLNTITGISKLLLSEAPLGPIGALSQLGGPDSFGGLGATYVSRFYDSFTVAHNRALEYGFATNFTNYTGELTSRAYGQGSAYKNGVQVGDVDFDQEKSNVKQIGASRFTVPAGITTGSGELPREKLYGLRREDPVNNMYYKGYSLEELQGSAEEGDRDFIKFYFVNANSHPNAGAMDLSDPNDKALSAVFRAHLTYISDFFQPSYNSYQYIGRADPVFTYNSFVRNFDVSFRVFASSKSQLRAQWQKLNYLASMTAPEYRQGKMTPPIMRVTIGDYFNEVPAIIRGLNFSEMVENTPWETNLENDLDVKQLPFGVSVNLNLTILHDSRPQLNGKFVAANQKREGTYGWLAGNTIDTEYSSSYDIETYNNVIASDLKDYRARQSDTPLEPERLI